MDQSLSISEEVVFSTVLRFDAGIESSTDVAMGFVSNSLILVASVPWGGPLARWLQVNARLPRAPCSDVMGVTPWPFSSAATCLWL